MNTPRQARSDSRTIRALSAVALLALAGGAQALEVYDWYPPFGTLTAYMGQPGNWGYVEQVPCGGCPGGVFDSPVTATALGPTVKGVMHGFMIDGFRFSGAILNQTAVINADLTLGSLHVLSSDPLWVSGASGNQRIIRRESGILTLAGTEDAALVVGSAGGGADRYTTSRVSFQGVVLQSNGSALVHSGGHMTLREQGVWAHNGSVVVGASTSASVTEMYAAGLTVANSNLVPSLGGRLELIVGSAGSGAMAVDGSAASPAYLEVHNLTVGGETAIGWMGVSAGASVRVWEVLRVGRGAGALLETTNGAVITAGTGQIGAFSGPDTGRLQIGRGSVVQFVQTPGALPWLNTGGTLDIGTAEWPATGMRGGIESEAGGLLKVEGLMRVGGAGNGWANMLGDLEAGSVEIGRGYAPGSGRLGTDGNVTIGTAGATAAGNVSLQGTATWTHGGQGTVHGSVGLGDQGGEVGQQQLLQVRSGGALAIDHTLTMGAYYNTNVSPTLQVDQGGTLTIGQVGVAPVFGSSVSIAGRGRWVQAGDAMVYGNVSVGESWANGAVPQLDVAPGGSLHVSGRVVAGPPWGGASGGPLRAEVLVEAGGLLWVEDALVLNTDTRLAGGGTVQGNVQVNGGTVAPGMSPGRLDILGDLRFGNDANLGPGRVVMELGSDAAAGVTYDVLDVRGRLDLGSIAILDVHLLGGFNAAGSYEFLRFLSLAGNGAGGDAWFRQINVFDADGNAFSGLSFELDNGRFGIHLAAVPEPPAALLITLGILCVLGQKRRRRAMH